MIELNAHAKHVENDTTLSLSPELEISENELIVDEDPDDLNISEAELDSEVTADCQDTKKRKKSQKEKAKGRKKTKFAQELDRALLKEHTPKAQAENMARQLLDYTVKDCKMTALEVEDKLLPETHFLDVSHFKQVDDSQYPELIRCSVPTLFNKETSNHCPANPKTTTKANLRKLGPYILILCTSGIRCMDVIRALRPLTGTNSDYQSNVVENGIKSFNTSAPIKFRIGKLFAKHIKLEDQAQYLDGYPVHIAVGTPNRVAKLLEMGALKTSNLKCIILDASYRDAKLRTLFTAAESRIEFFALYLEWLVRLCKCEEVPVSQTNVCSAQCSIKNIPFEHNKKDDETANISQCFRIDTEEQIEASDSHDTPVQVPVTKSRKQIKLEARQLKKKLIRETQLMAQRQPPLMCMF